MKTDTHEFPLRIGMETAEGLRRYQIKHELETMEDAAKSCLRGYLCDYGFLKLDDPPVGGALLGMKQPRSVAGLGCALE